MTPEPERPEAEEEEEFKCESCGVSFDTAAEKMEHAREKHGA